MNWAMGQKAPRFFSISSSILRAPTCPRPNQTSSRSSNARSLPSTFVLNAAHEIAFATTGAMSGADLERVLADTLGSHAPR